MCLEFHVHSFSRSSLSLFFLSLPSLYYDYDFSMVTTHVRYSFYLYSLKKIKEKEKEKKKMGKERWMIHFFCTKYQNKSHFTFLFLFFSFFRFWYHWKSFWRFVYVTTLLQVSLLCIPMSFVINSASKQLSTQVGCLVLRQNVFLKFSCYPNLLFRVLLVSLNPG